MFSIMFFKSLFIGFTLQAFYSVSVHGLSATSLGTTTCGGILKTASGAISYKGFQNVTTNERCVWIIRAPKATSYSVKMIGLDIPNSVIVAGFGNPDLSEFVVPSLSSPEFTIFNKTILVITFYTGSVLSKTNSRGFCLWYSSSTGGSVRLNSAVSKDHLLSASTAHVRYPEGESQYSDNELTTFLFTPGIDNSGNFKSSDVIFIQNKLEGTCYDKLLVYTFHTSLTTVNKWKWQMQICSDVESKIITNNDLIFILFQTDAGTTYTGFHLFSKTALCK